MCVCVCMCGKRYMDVKYIFGVVDDIFIIFFYFCQHVSTLKFACIQNISIKNYFKYENKNKIIMIKRKKFMQVQSLHQG